MIKVYVVDDEKLVRKGILGLIDWEKYGMEVVGDSGSGEEMLEFLRNHQVDLLFSDLEMPGISGVELLQAARRIRPRLQIVVLTMHQEFELIQQALRIGILDYITKAQIEEENVDSFMEGVVKRYKERLNHFRLEEKSIGSDRIYIWTAGEKNLAEKAAVILKDHGMNCEFLTPLYLLIQEPDNLTRLKALTEQLDRNRSSLVCLEQVRRVPYDQLEQTLKNQLPNRLFEDRRPGCCFYTYQYPQLQQERTGASRKEIMEAAMRMEFMMSQEEYQKGMEMIHHADMSQEERTAVFYHFNLYWSEFSEKDITRYFEEVGGFHWWYQWEEWFDGIRRLVLKKVGGTDEELGTIDAVHRAMNYIREHMDREITLEELLKLTGMSKSYFSRKFKELTGKTFVTYLNDMRIEAAKKYLRETKQPVYWIARQVGYTDEHYFRRIFREKTGETPKKYRNDN